MKLIKKVEIKYFRSIYSETLNEIKDLTIFFGRNDSGKSNFLRALNLFFNAETNPGISFLFERDLCLARAAEAETKKDARKFVSIKVFFNTPDNWKKSLGTEFYVRKMWSATKQSEPSFESSIPEGQKRIYLTRFLDEIKFHYIPAIKDRKIFDYLLGQVYSVMAETKEFSDSLKVFSQQVSSRTMDLNSEIEKSLKIKSVIAPPLDLLAIFRSLDFETTSKDGDKVSLTLQRGDGLQVRHIPSVLGFISDKSRESFHIWGFEEPENSLELAAAVEEAATLQKYSLSDNKQLFVTSHSPAFFSLRLDDVDRYFVRKENSADQSREISKTIRINEKSIPDDLMDETPHLPIMSERLDRLTVELRSSKELAEEIRLKSSKPVLFVEGISDKKVMGAAWKAFQNTPLPFEIESCSGTTKMKSLAADGRTFHHLVPDKKIFVLVDNDTAARELYKNANLDDGGKWIVHNSNKTYWCRLQPPDEFLEIMNELKILKSWWPITLENCFSVETRQRAMNMKKYKLGSEPDMALREKAFGQIHDVIRGSNLRQQMYIYPIDEYHKESFADWISAESESNADILLPFKKIVNSLSEILTAS